MKKSLLIIPAILLGVGIGTVIALSGEKAMVNANDESVSFSREQQPDMERIKKDYPNYDFSSAKCLRATTATLDLIIENWRQDKEGGNKEWFDEEERILDDKDWVLRDKAGGYFVGGDGVSVISDENNKVIEFYDAKTDPNATTVGEIRAKIRSLGGGQMQEKVSFNEQLSDIENLKRLYPNLMISPSAQLVKAPFSALEEVEREVSENGVENGSAFWLKNTKKRAGKADDRVLFTDKGAFVIIQAEERLAIAKMEGNVVTEYYDTFTDLNVATFQEIKEMLAE
ncbi:hypothetical protein SAMN02745116_01093 [Pilibacter termitis]|uniref:Uncharacterized protein n=1 Tax=Pilibacter termitis TaxID=263852 RepID=A0A1T4MHZ2_9ENTE|nr:hypothetical protein [Pilibacter termitis]SJZ66394.1 hypothetical protein SAMN02745116_01093 [Pilibacter termitis]